MSNSRSYTEEEVRDMILKHIRALSSYWADLPDIDKATGRVITIKDRCDGVAFSILSMLDGCSMEIPAINLKLVPHKEDKDFLIQNNENWFEPDMELSFVLHEHFYKQK